jgi:hypothetical protein
VCSGAVQGTGQVTSASPFVTPPCSSNLPSSQCSYRPAGARLCNGQQCDAAGSQPLARCFAPAGRRRPHVSPSPAQPTGSAGHACVLGSWVRWRVVTVGQGERARAGAACTRIRGPRHAWRAVRLSRAEVTEASGHCSVPARYAVDVTCWPTQLRTRRRVGTSREVCVVPLHPRSVSISLYTSCGQRPHWPAAAGTQPACRRPAGQLAVPRSPRRAPSAWGPQVTMPGLPCRRVLGHRARALPGRGEIGGGRRGGDKSEGAGAER